MTTPGLRERKKQRTREALTDAAYALFLHKGFDATTIDEIAEAVEVSSRTFFRYFASKEDVALSPLNQQVTSMLRLLAARPAEEPVITALRRSVGEIVRSYETDECSGAEPDRHRSMQALLGTNPMLKAYCLKQSTEWLGELASIIATRMGVELTEDPRPHLVASVMLSALRTTVDAWQELHPDVPASTLFDQAFDLLAGGLNYPAAVTTARPGCTSEAGD
ncbi:MULTISPECIES: TetR family transcriptional regulator [Actinoalloteichus]|uniref:Transcriptional regulator, TetR family n=1 Tax=Actinoalloteichus fjordicus TaxID=1612552 RepID=A0AAC9LDB0_9PSEU|nr:MULTISPECIES: TetR family transcriptional regulator [Actinoalloteichus]APU14730.1 transcriptional regulator, TetR family [Actinoalloteichus fjordicus]APU20698.1 transcriptional regulator, TetR family [Actinoalloteichus sp. GBA129-24]